MDFLSGGGELGALMRARDWAATPLGRPESWPQSLKTAVRIMLTSRQPFWLGWGPELTYLYNDPYKSIIGGKHPQALGRPFSEVWSEIWDVVGPMADTVMTRDEGTYVEAQLLIMERHGYQEETYYTFSYSPIPNDAGGRGGLICANTDDTRRVIGERQLGTLRELAARTANARTWQEACTLSAQSLALNPRDVPFALVYVEGVLAGAAGIDHGRGSALPFGQIGVPETRVLAADAAWGALPTGAWPKAPLQVALIPIAASGESGRAGVLAVGLNRFRKFDGDYRGFLDLVAGQISAAIGNAQAYERERERAESLTELDRAKTAFFSNVSHEFRTPLTLMLGPLDDLLTRSDGELPAAARALLEPMQRNGQRLLKLVNTLLDFARIEAGRAQASYQPVDLAAYTAELASNFRSACERAGLRLEVDCPPLAEPAHVDRGMWEKIVLNLLSNAFKFTLEGAIRVRVRSAGEHFRLEVQDTGSGIPAEQLPRMFERFHRVEGTRGRSHEGSGIGLALVQELVKLHGGSISVQSEPGRGSTFTVLIPRGTAHLPEGAMRAPRAASTEVRAGAYVEEALSWLPAAAYAEASPEGASPAQAGARGGPRIVLADDNADLREYARRLLAEHYEVEAVADGEAALAAVRARRPTLVVSDVMMPRLDGFGLLRALRTDPALRDIPVVLLSARAGEEARIEGLGEGADDYLVKPFSARELLVRVGTLLRSAQVRRAAEAALRESESRFRGMANTAPAILWITDPDGACTFLSQRWYELTGQIESEALGLGWTNAVHPDDREHAAAVFTRANRNREPFSLDYRLRRHDGAYRWAIDAGQPRFDARGDFLGFIGSVIDVHERKQAEQALREADRRKDEFLATLAHELRNPLAPLRNALQLMQLGGASNPPAVPLEIMERQVNHLVRLVDDLLEMARITRGRLELRRERVEVATVVRNAVETSDPLIQAAGHRLTVSLPGEPLWVDGDPVRLAQILANLLNNSARYTERGGEIEVHARREEGMSAIAVRDNGRGIPPELLPEIFEMFSRGERGAAYAPGGGLGIGLALARRLAEMHGGTLQAHSDGPGKGAEFLLRVPLAKHTPRAVAAAPDAGVLPGKRILVVDDNRDAADSLAMLLKFLGAEVSVVYDGPSALAAFESYRPGVVLLDIGMPGMDGFTVARKLREAPGGREVPIVAITGWGQEEDRRRARDAGFDHHLVKPPDMTALRSLLGSLH